MAGRYARRAARLGSKPEYDGREALEVQIHDHFAL